ncbi:hypothetical protein GCM10009657_11060 [Oryzihumus leptocrescens]
MRRRDDRQVAARCAESAPPSAPLVAQWGHVLWWGMGAGMFWFVLGVVFLGLVAVGVLSVWRRRASAGSPGQGSVEADARQNEAKSWERSRSGGLG